MSLLENAQLLQGIFSHSDSLELRGQICISGLTIEVRSANSNVAHWLAADFGESVSSSHSGAITVKAATICSDEWVGRLRKLIDSGDFKSENIDEPRKMIIRVNVSETVTVDYFPMLGIAWVTNKAEKLATLVHSSRTPAADAEFRSSLSDIIGQHMCSTGWKLLSASLVGIGGRNHLMMDAGDGTKTGAMIALVRNGASLISGDSSFVRFTDDSLEVQLCPSPIAINLGWAMKYSPLFQFIGRPDRLGLPQTKFDFARVWKTPKENLAQLPDQLLLRASEFASLMNSNFEPFAESNTIHPCVADVILLTEFNNNQDPITVAAPPEMAKSAVVKNLVNTNPRPSSLQLGFTQLPFKKEGLDRFVDQFGNLPTFGMTLNATTSKEPDYHSLVEKLTVKS